MGDLCGEWFEPLFVRLSLAGKDVSPTPCLLHTVCTQLQVCQLYWAGDQTTVHRQGRPPGCRRYGRVGPKIQPIATRPLGAFALSRRGKCGHRCPILIQLSNDVALPCPSQPLVASRSRRALQVGTIKVVFGACTVAPAIEHGEAQPFLARRLRFTS